MIFLSHNHLDKPVVEQVALELSQRYGQQNVFYDSWSIQPGQGIIDKMEEGLTKCKFFFFFVSQNSLTSEMVKLEWQNMLMRAAKKELLFIPIRMDNSEMPILLTQTMFVDLYSNGLDNAIRYIIDVIEGRNTFRQSTAYSANIRAYKFREGEKIIVECHAEYWVEMNPSFIFCTQSDTSKIKIDLRDEIMYSEWKLDSQEIKDGYVTNCVLVSLHRSMSPEFPLKVEFSSIDCSEFDIEYVLHEKSNKSFHPIQMSNGKTR